MIELIKIKYNIDTKEETEVPFILNIKDIICLYKDRNGVFIVTNQGFMNKVPYNLEALSKYLEF